jgi:O-antigen ligase
MPGFGEMLLGAWFLYLLIAPTWGFFWIDAWHNEQRAVQVILISATALIGIGVPVCRLALIPRSPAALLLCAVGGLGVLASLQARFVAAAFADVSLYVLLAALAAIVASTVRAHPQRLSIWARRACVFLGAVHVTGIAARYGAMSALERAPDIDVLLLGYANPRFPSALYALLMPFIAMCALDRQEHAGLRRVAWGVLALLWCVNIALGTRAIWFAYGMLVPLMAWFAGWPRVRPAAQTLAITAGVGLGAYLLLFVAVPVWLGLGDALPSQIQHLTSVNDRALLWRQSLGVVMDHPLLGIGPMNLAGLGGAVASHPHNWILQVAAEWGLPAVALLCWALWNIANRVRLRLRNTDRDDLDMLGPLAAVLIGLAYGLVDGNLVMPVSQTAFALAAGLLCGTSLGDTHDVAAARPLAAVAGLVLVVVSAAILPAYVAQSLPRQEQNERAWRHLSKYPDLAPRFWQQGLLL